MAGLSGQAVQKGDSNMKWLVLEALGWIGIAAAIALVALWLNGMLPG